MSIQASFEIDRSQRRFGPIWLTPGISPLNVMVMFFSAMMTIVFVTGIGVLQPYLLAEHIKMPTSEQGDFIGTLTVYVEIISIALVLPLGTLSDKIGRTPLWVGSFTLVCVACILFPLARTPEMFMLGRILMGIGFATGTMMLGTVIADYPQNASRGKLISINGFITGVGVVLVAAFGFSLLPTMFAARGYDAVTSGTYTFWVIAAIAGTAALITLFGIKDGRPHRTEKKDPFLVNLRKGFAETTRSPRLSIAGVAYFVSRGDPFSSGYIYPVVILAGAGEACILVSGPALVGQEASGKIRGAVFGMMAVCGALGVLIHSKVCGLLFDAFTYQTPFLYMAGLNAAVAVAALMVRWKTGSKHIAQPTAA
jgi:MFS family permease